MLALLVNLLLLHDSMVFSTAGVGLLHETCFFLGGLHLSAAVEILPLFRHSDDLFELASTVLSLVLLKGTLGTQLVNF